MGAVDLGQVDRALDQACLVAVGRYDLADKDVVPWEIDGPDQPALDVDRARLDHGCRLEFAGKGLDLRDGNIVGLAVDGGADDRRGQRVQAVLGAQGYLHRNLLFHGLVGPQNVLPQHVGRVIVAVDEAHRGARTGRGHRVVCRMASSVLATEGMQQARRAISRAPGPLRSRRGSWSGLPSARPRR